MGMVAITAHVSSDITVAPSSTVKSKIASSNVSELEQCSQ